MPKFIFLILIIYFHFSSEFLLQKLTGIKDNSAPALFESQFFLPESPVEININLSHPSTTTKKSVFSHHYTGSTLHTSIQIQCAPINQNCEINTSIPNNKIKTEKEYFNLRDGLTNTFDRIKTSKPLTVAYVGGSITWGPGWRDKISNYLKERYPNSTFRFINAGIPSLGSLPHAFRFQKEILSLGRIDLMFYESAVNDRVNKTDSIVQLRALEGIVRQARKSNPLMDIIFMSFADQFKNQDFDRAKLPYEIANHELVAEHYNLPSINLAREIYDRQLSGEFSWEYDFKDLHPSPFGHNLYFSSLKRLWESALIKWQRDNNQSHTFIAPSKLITPIDKFNFGKAGQLSVHEAIMDNKWTIIKNWTPLDGKPGREGFINRSVVLANEPEAEITLSFKGSAIGIGVLSGPDAGILTYSIDNQPYKSIDLYTEWSHVLHLPWFLLFESDLVKTQHKIKIKISPIKNSSSIGHACRILYFLINRQ